MKTEALIFLAILTIAVYLAIVTLVPSVEAITAAPTATVDILSALR